MRRALLVLIIAVVLFAAAGALLAPASLVAPLVERASGGRVIAGELEGSVWRGRGVFGTASARLPIAWTLDPLPLASGEIALHLAPVDGRAPAPRGDITAARNRVTLANLALELPASALADVLARNAPLRAAIIADGMIAITTPRLDWAPAASSGDARIVWHAARLTVLSGTPVDLGEITATLAAAGDRLAGTITNAGGDLDVRGDVALMARGGANVSLLLTPRRAADQGLARALSAIGTPDGAGWRVNWPAPAR